MIYLFPFISTIIFAELETREKFLILYKLVIIHTCLFYAKWMTQRNIIALCRIHYFTRIEILRGHMGFFDNHLHKKLIEKRCKTWKNYVTWVANLNIITYLFLDWQITYYVIHAIDKTSNSILKIQLKP